MPDKIVSRETLDFIFDYTRDAPERQLKDVEALDSKMVQVFSAASVIIGLGGLSGHAGGATTAALMALAVVSYIGVGVAAFKHLRVREFRRSLQADMVWRKLWRYSTSEIKHSLVHDTALAYAHNKQLIREKGTTLRWALGAVTAEVVFVGCSLVASRLV